MIMAALPKRRMPFGVGNGVIEIILTGNRTPGSWLLPSPEWEIESCTGKLCFFPTNSHDANILPVNSQSRERRFRHYFPYLYGVRSDSLLAVNRPLTTDNRAKPVNRFR